MNDKTRTEIDRWLGFYDMMGIMVQHASNGWIMKAIGNPKKEFVEKGVSSALNNIKSLFAPKEPWQGGDGEIQASAIPMPGNEICLVFDEPAMVTEAVERFMDSTKPVEATEVPDGI